MQMTAFIIKLMDVLNYDTECYPRESANVYSKSAISRMLVTIVEILCFETK